MAVPKYILALLLVFGFCFTAFAQEQSQPLNFYSCEDDFSSFYPVVFDVQTAQDGWVIQIVCAGADGIVDPPDENGNPTGDDFLAHPEYNNIQSFTFNSAQNSMPEGNFWQLQSVNCRAADFMPGTENIIRVGDIVYLRAFNNADWTQADLYVDMMNPYTVPLIQAGKPYDKYGIEFNPTGLDSRLDGLVITEYKLHQNYPNPFNPTTTITFDVLETGKVNLSIYNIAGQEVAALVNQVREGGKRYQVVWNAQNVSSGIYFMKMQVNDYKAVKKLLLLQ